MQTQKLSEVTCIALVTVSNIEEVGQAHSIMNRAFKVTFGGKKYENLVKADKNVTNHRMSW